jgi:hypothetical protein
VSPKIVLLCDGLGSRLREQIEYRPKCEPGEELPLAVNAPSGLRSEYVSHARPSVRHELASFGA